MATDAVELSTQPQAPPRPQGYGPVGWLRWGWRTLTSMRTALVLLFLLALAAVPGSVFPQRGTSPARVQQYFTDHPTFAPVADRLSLFDVFAAPWFAAVYLLLFISLAGCVIPRSWRHLRSSRAEPPPAPRFLDRLPHSDSWETAGDPGEVVGAVRRVLTRRHFRVTTYDAGVGPDAGVAVAAEKGYLREVGNLVFHLALLLLLMGVALGGMFGYKATRLVVVGTGFSNSVGAYDSWKPGRFTSEASLPPFSVELDRFAATYVTSGSKLGEPRSFDAHVRYKSSPGARWQVADIGSNHPLRLDGTKIYLIGHGYAPTFTVRDDTGRVVFHGPVAFLPQDGNLTSTGVIKAPDARPEQLGFTSFLFPTAVLEADRTLVSRFPGTLNPVVQIVAFRGDLGLDSSVPQSVYALDDTHMHKVATATLGLGDRMRLPGGKGSLTFDGIDNWASFQVTHDPGKPIVLWAAGAMVAGLILSLRIRRRRIWVRVLPGAPGRTVVAAGGLGRTDSAANALEWDDVTAELRAVTEQKGQ